MKVAIICRDENKSPKVLALSLRHMLVENGQTAEIFYDGIGLIGRLLPLFSKRHFKSRFHFILRQKIRYFLKDRKLLKTLSQYDVIVLSECIPNAYWRGHYDIERLRNLTGKPVCLYEVYFLLTTPYQTHLLQKAGDWGVGRYDWNFSVSDTTELKLLPTLEEKWSVVGLDLSYTGLIKQEKNDFVVLVDFEQQGFEKSRIIQLEVLKELEIATIDLNKRFELSEIRNIYKKSSVLLVQFPEAFGLPIAECLATGTYIFVNDETWAMAWRKKDENGQFYLPECFIKYSDREDLKLKLSNIRNQYDPVETPRKVCQIFLENYPHFYRGNQESLQESLNILVN